jgi:DNA transformation protein
MASPRNANDDFRDFVRDQLDGLEYLKCTPMFGGYGLYLQKIFFGIVFDSRLFYRVNAETEPALEAADSETFRPRPGMEMKGYREVPADILEDASRLRAFTLKAAEVPPGQQGNLRP